VVRCPCLVARRYRAGASAWELDGRIVCFPPLPLRWCRRCFQANDRAPCARLPAEQPTLRRGETVRVLPLRALGEFGCRGFTACIGHRMAFITLQPVA